MMFPEPKNVIFVEILLHPNFSLRNSGLPYFYRVKLDVIGFGQKAHFWNRETSYIKVLYMISHELDDVHLKFFKMTREGGHGVGLGTNLVANDCPRVCDASFLAIITQPYLVTVGQCRSWCIGDVITQDLLGPDLQENKI